MSSTILCIHGIGQQEADPRFRKSWESAIRESWNAEAPEPEIVFLEFDAIFAAHPPGGEEYLRALKELLGSWISTSIGELFGTRGFFDLPQVVQWTAGMVAQWAVSNEVRDACRERLSQAVQQHTPELILAHSLGSLIAYDTFARAEGAALLQDRSLVTFGSQIGHPALRREFGGRIEALSQARLWMHLYNVHDHVFTEALHLSADNFTQVLTPFDLEGDPLNHEATAYLRHPATKTALWRGFVPAIPAPLVAIDRGIEASLRRLAARPRRRALLVGINEYPNASNRLSGCVNDVFLMSAVLQEAGFDSRDIRIVLDHRAKAAAIRERLEWLLDGTRAGDERVFFYSGHGAQISTYGAGQEVDRLDECLVPYDFDWTPPTALTDDEFYDLYAQLPYEAHFVAIFDCCHAGGMTREGGLAVRGLSPPDDLRHRLMAWHEGRWGERPAFPTASSELARSAQGSEYLGARGACHRLGRAIPLRKLQNSSYDAARLAFGHYGPYLPVILEASQEDERAYEYRDGANSYGAFTYQLASQLRRAQRLRTPPDLGQTMDVTGRALKRLGFRQKPVLVGAARALKEASKVFLPPQAPAPPRL